jgi:hypothetical protein
MELCFLSSVYINLLIAKQPMYFHFKPYPDAFPDNILRVSPDILPPDSIFLDEVWIDGEPHHDFDRQQLTVKLPPGGDRKKVRVKITPATWLDRAEAS